MQALVDVHRHCLTLVPAAFNMLCDKNPFSCSRKAQYPLQVQHGDGHNASYWCKGKVNLPIKSAITNEVKTLTFKGAWLADEAVFNLASVHALTKEGFKVTFTSTGAVIEGNGQRINVPPEDLLHYLDVQPRESEVAVVCAARESKGESLQLWYARISHYGLSVLERMAKMKGCPVQGVEITDLTRCMCEVCILPKLKDCSHPLKGSHKPTAPYEILWSDLAGPLNVATREGNRYVLGILDECSRCVWVHFLKAKSEAVVKFEEFLTRHLIRVVDTDQGGEYQSQFNSMLSRH